MEGGVAFALLWRMVRNVKGREVASITYGTRASQEEGWGNFAMFLNDRQILDLPNSSGNLFHSFGCGMHCFQQFASSQKSKAVIMVHNLIGYTWDLLATTLKRQGMLPLWMD